MSKPIFMWVEVNEDTGLPMIYWDGMYLRPTKKEALECNGKVMRVQVIPSPIKKGAKL